MLAGTDLIAADEYPFYLISGKNVRNEGRGFGIRIGRGDVARRNQYCSDKSQADEQDTPCHTMLEPILWLIAASSLKTKG